MRFDVCSNYTVLGDFFFSFICPGARTERHFCLFFNIALCCIDNQ